MIQGMRIEGEAVVERRIAIHGGDERKNGEHRLRSINYESWRGRRLFRQGGELMDEILVLPVFSRFRSFAPS